MQGCCEDETDAQGALYKPQCAGGVLPNLLITLAFLLLSNLPKGSFMFSGFYLG